jgi:hypothetical protein
MIKGYVLLLGLGLAAGPNLCRAVPFQLHGRTWTAGRMSDA